MAAKQSLSVALEPRASLSFDDYVTDCAWSPDGTRLAVAGGEGRSAWCPWATPSRCSKSEDIC